MSKTAEKSYPLPPPPPPVSNVDNVNLACVAAGHVQWLCLYEFRPDHSTYRSKMDPPLNKLIVISLFHFDIGD